MLRHMSLRCGGSPPPCDGSISVPFLSSPLKSKSSAWQTLTYTFSMTRAKLTKFVQATGPENVGLERTPPSHLAPRPVNNPSRITLQNNGKIRPHLDGENAFVRASGGGDGPDIQPSPPPSWLKLLLSSFILIPLVTTSTPRRCYSLSPLRDRARWGPSLFPPEPHRFVAHIDAAFVQQIFDVPQREREADVQHYR